MGTLTDFNIFVGAETGILKGVNAVKKSWINLNSIECADRENEITAMCWGDENQQKVCLGLKSKTVVEYDSAADDLVVFEHMQKTDGCFRGIAKLENLFVTCTDKGLLQSWTINEENPVTINVGENIRKMRQNPTEPHMFATGGEENDLKLWDLNNPDEPVFKAKNVKNDFLNLRVPVCVMDIGFSPVNKCIIVGTGHHQVRVYDPNSSQRRPVLDMDYDEYPVTAIGVRPNTQQVVVGNTKGNMALLDLRMKGRAVNVFKGVDGSIRCIQCHSTQDLVASCGLDRFLRVHDLNTKKITHKFYLKSRLNCLLFADKWEEETEVETPKKSMKSKRSADCLKDSGNESENENVDEIWDQMEQLEDPSNKQKILKKKDKDDVRKTKKPKIKLKNGKKRQS